MARSVSAGRGAILKAPATSAVERGRPARSGNSPRSCATRRHGHSSMPEMISQRGRSSVFGLLRVAACWSMKHLREYSLELLFLLLYQDLAVTAATEVARAVRCRHAQPL